MSFLSSLLSGPARADDRLSVSLMLTYSCQLKCGYCQVLQRGSRITKKVIDGAVSFLGRSAKKKLELKFFGGEPLLEFELLKYAVTQAQRRLGAKKDLQYCLVTNGIGLDAAKIAYFKGLPSQVVFSFDGGAATHAAFRSGPGGNSHYKDISANLRLLAASGAYFFVNVVVSPENLRALRRNLEHIAGLGVKRIQLCYNGAAFWSGPDIMRLVRTLSAFRKSPAGKKVSFLNSSGDSEPVALHVDLIVDTDGLVYMDGAMFMEKRFPGGRRHFFIGKAAGLGRPEDVYADRREHLRRWRKVCACAEEKKVFLSSLKTGAALGLLFRGPGKQTAPARAADRRIF